MDATARFDGDESFALSDYRGELVARTPDEVVEVVRSAEREAAAGAWVAGWVAYEAAPGFDAALPVRAGTDVPLVWFGVFAQRSAAAPLAVGPSPPVWDLDLAPEEHCRQVSVIKDWIERGLTYQVNLTGRARSEVADPTALYAHLVHAQQPRYAALIESPTHTVVCASPELFFSLDERSLVTRPMKGTARRGRWPAEDRTARDRLAASPKERAENVMIVDLVRNDIGRVAEFGSVRVASLFDVERYPTVWQMTSTVEGTLRPEAGLAEVFTALFPSGSVTGAPKRSSMRCIADLEPRRGVYCGAVGYVAPAVPARATFAVAIRTATIDRRTGRGSYGAGGGITWSSEAGAEWRELTAKLEILGPRPDICGLFETMRGDGHNWSRHLDRLEASAAYLGWPFDRAAAEALLPADDATPTRVRVDLDRTGTVRVSRRAFPAFDGPVRLGFDDEPVDSTDVRLFLKTSDRTGYDRRRARRPDVDDVILVNERGEVTESTIANIAVRIDGRWWTPPVDSGLLPGVERARLIESDALAPRVIYPEEVREVALVSSLRGWRPATVVERRPTPTTT